MAIGDRGKGMIVERKGRCLSLLIAGAAFSVIAVTAQSESSSANAPTRVRYLSGYTAWGEWPTIARSSLKRGAMP